MEIILVCLLGFFILPNSVNAQIVGPVGGLSSGQADSSYVNITGDTMTGQLTLAGSSLTVTGASGEFGVRISSNLYIIGYSSAAKYYGDGSALTGGTGTDNTKVLKTGDTMTGPLTLSGSTLTVMGAQGVNVTYGVTAGTFTGNGAALTALTAANLTGTVPTGLVDLSTVTTALAGKLANDATVSPSLVDLSTVTTALTGKLTAPATFYITKLSESLTAPATFYVVKNTDYLTAPATFTYQIPGDYITSLTGAVTASGPGAAATTIVSVPSAAINLSTVTANHVLKAGDTMTGQLTLSGSTLTVTGNAFSVGGSTFVVSGGKVGIGTATPGAKLDVVGDANISTSLTTASMTVTNLTLGSIPFIGTSGGVNQDNGNFFWNAGNAQLLIGTNVSHARLNQQYESSIFGQYGGQQIISWSATGAHGPVIDLSHSKSNTIGTHALLADGDFMGAINWRASNGASFFPITGIESFMDGVTSAASLPSRLVFSTTESGSTSPSERMRIANNGNIGIGDTAPQAKLTVNGNIVSTGTVQITDTGTVGGTLKLVRSDSPSTHYTTLAGGGGYGDFIVNQVGDVGWTQAIQFQNNGTPLMTMIPNGNVGIGNTTPGSKLHVTGDATISTSLTVASMTVTGNAFSVGTSTLIVTGGKVGIGNISPSELLEVAGGIASYSRTMAQLLAITPSQVGVQYFCNNCTPAKMVVSTGTAVGNFADIMGGTFQ